MPPKPSSPAPAGPASGVQAVALAAGVSAMTVSRVLRNSPQVSPETRQRVQAAATALGYRPDPQIARLMGIVRGHRTRRVRSKIAVVRDDLPEDTLHDDAYHYVALEDIRRRADQHGYEVEEFGLGAGGISPRRLGKILHARGIGGLLVSVQSTRQFSAQLDYAGFAAATFGYGLTVPSLHRASTNMTHGILAATALLESRGYRRIGVAISPWIDERADHTYSGALLHYQQRLPARQCVPLLLFPDNDLARGETRFRAWMRRHRPDAIISFHRHVPGWLRDGLGLRIPEDVGIVIHDWIPSMAGFAGIDHRRAHVAAAGVDLVATQLQHNEQGIPGVPRQILIPPAVMDGPSIRAAGCR